MLMGETSSGAQCYWNGELKSWIFLDPPEGYEVGALVPKEIQVNILRVKENIAATLRLKRFREILNKVVEEYFDTEYWKKFYGEGDGIPVSFLERDKK